MAAPVEAYDEMRPLETPVRLRGTVVRGFGRGSKQLGIPTANLDADALGPVVDALPAGIYFGWASVGADPAVHKMVMSVGWNPYYKNERKTVEPHLLHVFEADFYDQQLRLVVTGYLRPEKNYPSLDALIDAIHTDIKTAASQLEAPHYAGLRGDAFLAPQSTTEGAHAAAAAPGR